MTNRLNEIRRKPHGPDVYWLIEKVEELTRERDEALRVRDLAREASNRDLMAKREAEAKLHPKSPCPCFECQRKRDDEEIVCPI